jgi:hypothetical protein
MPHLVGLADTTASARAKIRQYGRVLTPLVALTTPAAVHLADVHRPLVTSTSFGVGRAFAVLVALFAMMFALMVLGGHLRASRQRRRNGRG